MLLQIVFAAQKIKWKYILILSYSNHIMIKEVFLSLNFEFETFRLLEDGPQGFKI